MMSKVDDAMAAQRLEKRAIRELWVEEVRRADSDEPDPDVPLYLTLPGKQGGDLRALVEAGVIELTETGAIAETNPIRVVAVEGSTDAVLELSQTFPGLKILEHRLEDLLKATSDLAWPSKATRRWFRAQVVNFDINTPLKAELHQKQLVFPVLRMVEKVARMHAQEPCVDWTLCLTLHGELVWTDDVDRLICRFLARNFRDEPEFSEQAKVVLGHELHEAICECPDEAGLCQRSVDDQQNVLTVLVPKRIAHESHQRGWHVDTAENLRYGGSDGKAPMVTWILRFTWDERTSTEPAVVYRESLKLTLQNQGYIDAQGKVRRTVQTKRRRVARAV
jgi:hypothetical protein